MKWPPNKAWKTNIPIKGHSYFVAINYGGRGEKRWVNLVSVIDGRVRLKVSFLDITNDKVWENGWAEKNLRNEKNFHSRTTRLLNEETENNFACIHPSIDAGFLSTEKEIKIRPW